MVRKLYSFMVVTLDGFYEGPNGEFDWADTRIVGGNVAEEVANLKQQPGKGIAMMGSPSLTVS